MAEKDKRFISYPVEDAEFRPVVTIGGREFAVMPYMSTTHIPQELFDFVKQHPERDDVDRMISHGAESLLQDILAYLRDAVAVTAVEWYKDENLHDYRLVLPVLMPMDTSDRWQERWSPQRDERLRNEAIERQKTGKPYVFKTVEKNESGVWSRPDEGSKRITIDGYHMHFICEVEYPEVYTNRFEKELLETIATNACEIIESALDSDSEEERKKVENRLHGNWMSILGTYYRDYVTRVELSKYEDQSQPIYKVHFISRFIYD